MGLFGGSDYHHHHHRHDVKYNNNNKFTNLTFLIVIVIGIILCNESIVRPTYALPVLTSIYPLVSFTQGNTPVTVIGTQFPEVPQLRLLHNTLGIIQFTITPITTPGTYIFLSPPEPTIPPSGDALSGSKKRQRTDLLLTVQIYFPTTNLLFYQNTFSYIKPTIISFSPSKYLFDTTDGIQVHLQGDDLRTSTTDPRPTVNFVSSTLGAAACVVSGITDSTLDFKIPNGVVVDNVNIEITFYNGQTILSDSQFSYVEPHITSIQPTEYISTKSTRLTINGVDFIDDSDYPRAKVILGILGSGGVELKNLVWVSTSRITVDTPVWDNIDPGNFLKLPLSLSFGSANAIGSESFTSYTPMITKISPKRGLISGGTDVKVEGKFLFNVASVTIGSVPCTIKPLTVKMDEFVCTTGLKLVPLNVFSEEDVLKAIIDGETIESPQTEKFKYYSLNIKSIEPTTAINKGTTDIVIKGDNLLTVESVIFGNNVQTVTPIQLLMSETEIKCVFDSSLHTSLGDIKVKVKEQTILSNELTLTIVEPSIQDYNIKSGYLKQETIINIRVSNFPPINQMTFIPPQPHEVFQFTFANKPCVELALAVPNDYSEFVCKVPKGDAVGDAAIGFSINTFLYTTTLKYKYIEPKITLLTQSNKIPKGGGTMTLTGVDLHLFDEIKVDGVSITPTVNCLTTGTTKVECVMPKKRPGNYKVVAQVLGNDYDAPTNLFYEGPAIDSISPKQWPKKKDVTITINGQGFGNDASKIKVTIGTVDCPNVDIETTNTVITCDRDGEDTGGTFDVVVSVKPATIGASYVDSIDDIKFIGQQLSCLGLPEPDGSNPSVDWWFTYKLHGTSSSSNYLYMDPLRDELEKHNRLSNVNSRPYSPLSASFDQYFDGYYNMIINDQPGSRTSTGNRDNAKKPSGSHGHVKGIVIWEEDPVTHVASGIHIIHSNPCFPATSGSSYYAPDKGIYFLGNPDYNQHFFCYKFNNLNRVGEYLLKNDAPLNTHKVPDMSKWQPIQIANNWAIYDFLQPHKKWSVRGGSSSQHAISVNCQSQLANTPNVLNICYWISPTFQIGGRDANLFMKTSVKKKNVGYPAVGATHPANLSRFVMKNMKAKTPSFDGVDTWQVVASHYGRKMFVEMFYAIGAVQSPVPEELLNVGYIHVKPSHAVRKVALGTGVVTYEDYETTGKVNEHAKLAYPLYPAYDDHANDANENMFCVGDSNRHNGQGIRGGGALCFQHPQLVYQFNRMTKGYNSLNGTNRVHVPPTSITYSGWITQPLRLTRTGWNNRVIIEIKDLIGGTARQKQPRQFANYDLLTADQEIVVSAIRTSVNPVNIGTELSVVGAPAQLPGQADVVGFHADDTLSPQYIAHDPSIATICEYHDDYVNNVKQCNQQNNALATVIHEPTPPPLNTFPSVRNVIYNEVQAVRIYDVLVNNEFMIMKFINQFRAQASIPLPPLFPAFQILNNPALMDTSVFNTPHIVRKAPLICHDELAYLMLLNYAYVKSGATDASKVVFKIGLDEPNWANGVLLAISKALYLMIDTTKDASFNACMEIPKGLDNLATYLEVGVIEVPTNNQLKLFHRSATATWDLMVGSYRDGSGGRVAKLVTATDRVPWNTLLAIIINLKPTDNINSLHDIYTLKLDQATYSTPANDLVFINNYLTKKPEPMVIDSSSSSSGGLLLLSSHQQFLSLFSKTNIITSSSSSSFINNNNRQEYNEPILDLFNQTIVNQLPFPEELILKMSINEILELNDALKKWVAIDNRNQAIQTLLLFDGSGSLLRQQEIQYLEYINRDVDLIDLCYPAGTSTIQLCTPQSITSITKFIESTIVSTSSTVQQFGDLQVYFLSNPTTYPTSSSPSSNGLAIATFNSKICDIQLTTLETFNNRYSSLYQISGNSGICSKSGPIITSVTPLNGPTNGNNRITLNGIRFQTQMVLNVGSEKFTNPILITNNQTVAVIPPNIGINHLLTLTTNTKSLLYQLQSYRYSYDAPIIVFVSPTVIDSNGGTILTIMGNNFGIDASNLLILLDNSKECLIKGPVTHTQITCKTPPGVGLYKSISIHIVIDGERVQSTRFHNAQSIPYVGYEAPKLSGLHPTSADAGDYVYIRGDGFGYLNDSDPVPNLYVGGELVEIINNTNNQITIKLPAGVGSAPIYIEQLGQIAVQPLETSFRYMPPYISQLILSSSSTGQQVTNQSILISSTNGNVWIIIKGFGWGLSPYQLDPIRLVQTNSAGSKLVVATLTNCQPFNTFMECRVPPGIGQQLTINGSVANQPIETDYGVTISYAPPVITSLSYTTSDPSTLTLIGYNFVPSGYTSYQSNTTYIMLVYPDGSPNTQVKCPNPLYINSNMSICNSITSGVNYQSVYISVGGQLSNSKSLQNISGLIYNDKNFDNQFSSSSSGDSPYTSSMVVISLQDTVSGSTQYTKITAGGYYYFFRVQPGQYVINAFNLSSDSFTPLNLFKIVVTNTTQVIKNIAVFTQPSNSTCTGIFKSTNNEQLQLMDGTFDLTKFGFCTINTTCQNPINNYNVTNGCQYQITNNQITISKPAPTQPPTQPPLPSTFTFTLKYYIDQNITGYPTFIYPTDPSSFSVSIFYWNASGLQIQYGYVNNVGSISFSNIIPNTSVTVLVKPYDLTLNALVNNHTIIISNHNLTFEYPLYYLKNSAYPVAQFWSEANLQGTSLTLPAGKFTTSLLGRFGWLDKMKSFTADKSMAVYIYETALDSSIRLDLPLNGPAVNVLKTIGGPGVGRMFEIAAINLFSFNSDLNPIPSSTGAMVKFDNIHQQYPTKFYLDGILMPCSDLGLQLNCKFPALPGPSIRPLTISNENGTINYYKYSIYYSK